MVKAITKTKSCNILPGAQFESYAEFEKFFELWKKEGNHNLRIASSDRLKENDPDAERFKYRYVVFNCIHYGEPRIRGQGKRPNQSYLSCGCKVTMRLHYLAEEGVLEVSKLVEEHTGHDEKTRVARFMQPDFPSIEDNTIGNGPKDEIYQKQLEYVNWLMQEREEVKKKLASRRNEKGLSLVEFDFPPINRDTAYHYSSIMNTDDLFRQDEIEKFERLTAQMKEEKFGHFLRCAGERPIQNENEKENDYPM